MWWLPASITARGDAVCRDSAEECDASDTVLKLLGNRVSNGASCGGGGGGNSPGGDRAERYGTIGDTCALGDVCDGP